MQALFGTVFDPSKSNAWHITTLETTRELKESYPLWNHVRDTEFPREAVIENLVITGIAPRPDPESLIDFLDKLGSQTVPGGTLTLVAGETGMTPGDWKIILRILGWDIEPGEGRFVRAARRTDE